MRTLIPCVLALGAMAFSAPASAQEVPCASPAQFPCSYQMREVELQRVPQRLKFQARVSQAKLPVGEGVFATVVVRLLQGANNVLCTEQFSNVQVKNSVLNLSIGAQMDCELDEVVAENTDLRFQVCLGGPDNCLAPIELAATPYAIKASFASTAQTAHTATRAAQAHYAYRVTADRDLQVRSSLGTGYFDFYTPAAGQQGPMYSDAQYRAFSDGGFLQWTPVRDRSALNLHITGKDQATDRPVELGLLVLGSKHTLATGSLTTDEKVTVSAGGIDVTGDSLVDGTLEVTGQTRVTSGGLYVTADGLYVTGDSSITGNLDVVGGGLTVAKAGAFGGGLTVAETGAFGGGLSVGGAAIFQGPVTFQGGVNIAGQPGPIPNTAWSDGAANWLFINGDEQGAASDYDWISIEANEGVMISPGDSGLVVQGGSSFAGNVAVEGNARVDTLWVTGPDLLFGPLADRGAGGRALVHTGNNSLTANYAGDFGGGLIVEGPGLTVNGTARVGGLVQTGPDLRISFAPNGDGGRALSHTGGDTLLINQGQDFSGGTRVDGPLTTGIITLTDSDLRISAARNGAGGRALTHDGGNNLVINYNGDFARTFVQGSGLDVSGQLTTGTLTTGTLTTGGLHLTGADLVIAAAGRGDGGRALVHDNNDKLIINYANDFGGGTEMGGRLTVWGELNLRHDTVRINTARAIHRNPGNNWLEIDSDRSYAGTWVNSHVFSVASNISANGFNRSGCVRIDSGTNGGDLWCPEGFYVAGAQNNNNDAQQIDMIWCCRPR